LKLSVIIVNYNVEYFLEQCLNSVQKAIKGIQAEVFVVDNISVDGSVAMVRNKFPWVRLIANTENVGFSKANNQAMRQAIGEYVLLLNPDTIVEEDTFQHVIDFMDKQPDAGGLGVKMIDGKGNFLPESKRGLPTPIVAFYKIFGLAALFPKSRTFGKYHLGYLSKDEVHEIEILSGAFMLMRKTALDKVGLLDEDFFMYGEDIDLSYRILKGGYKNYYYPHTRIIHYKGESTKKSSVNYVFVFYNAMIIFAQKHFSSKNAKAFSMLIRFAIYLRAGMAIMNRFLKRLFFPIVDFVGVVALLEVLSALYQNATRIDFVDFVTYWSIPIYAFLWVTIIYLSGGYDKPVKLQNTLKGGLVGLILVLIVYGLLPKDFQFSRLFIFIAALVSIFVSITTRLIAVYFNIGGYALANAIRRKFVIVGDRDEAERIRPLLFQMMKVDHFATVSPTTEAVSDYYVGNVNQLSDYIHINKIDEVIFCAKNLSTQQIIALMSAVKSGNKVDFKIAQPDSLFLIGSNSIHTAGDLYFLDLNTINTVENKRNKRLFDVLVSVVFLFGFPVICWMVRNKLTFLRNLFLVFVGKKTWVGYSSRVTQMGLPTIKNGVLQVGEGSSSQDLINKEHVIYVKDYSLSSDIKIIVDQFNRLGN
jgi:O-antigen biosynthesis protein